MANNEISTAYQNNKAKLAALEKLKELERKMKNMICITTRAIESGRMTIREHYIPKKRKRNGV